jgi:integrase
MNTTFAEQAAEYIRLNASGRNPLAPGTLRAYQSYLKARLIPQIGSKRLQDITDLTVKMVVDRICPDLSAQTVSSICKVFKGVMDSAVDENGRKLFAQEWNWTFIDRPAVVQADRNTPEIGPEALQDALRQAQPEDKLLWAFLAGSGLRIGEAMAVRTTPEVPGNVWNPAEKTITVEVQQDEKGNLEALKTGSSRRIVDLCSELNNFLLKHHDAVSFNGELFPSREKKARARLDRDHPSTGFHAFRRFRLTQLDAAAIPDGLNRFWSGHAGRDVHQRYAKWGSLLEERRQWAEKVGLGFELPEEQ